ncbi:MAG: leucine-rich repeat protein [Paludibacteraceae bacterium]|nr:leucine-rich repeat protein [Paludibacteraceae bacterium]
MKKSILLMVLGLVLTNLSTQAATEVNGIWYEFNDGKQTATVVAATAPAYYAGDVVIPAKVNAYDVVAIGHQAFENCDRVKTISIPASVTSVGVLGYNPMANCDSLVSINVDTENPNYSSVDGVLFNKSQNTLLAYPAGKEDIHYEIPNTVTTIGLCAFEGATHPMNIPLPNNLETIGMKAFSGCTSLYAAFLHDGCTQISNNAYEGCTALTRVSLPSSLNSIGAKAFSGCVSVQMIQSMAKTPPTLGDNVFENVPASTALVVPDDVLGTYITKDQWKELTVISTTFYDAKTDLGVVIGYMNRMVEIFAFCHLPETEYPTFFKAWTDAQITYDKAWKDLTVAGLQDAKTAAYSALDAAVTDLIPKAKDSLMASLDSYLLPDDGQECKNLVVVYKMEIDHQNWDNSKSYDENLNTLYYQFQQLIYDFQNELNTERYMDLYLAQLKQLVPELEEIRSFGYMFLEDTDPLFTDIDAAIKKGNTIIKKLSPTYEEVIDAVSDCNVALGNAHYNLVPAVKDVMKKSINDMIKTDDSPVVKQMADDATNAIENYAWHPTKSVKDSEYPLLQLYLTAKTDIEIAQRTVEASDITDQTATISWGFGGTSFDLRYKKALIMDFESGRAPFTTLDADGDKFNWFFDAENGSINPADSGFYMEMPVHGGKHFAYSQSSVGSGLILTPDNWLISPLINLSGSISFYAAGIYPYAFAEYFGVYISTTGTSPADFVWQNGWTPTDANYAKYSVNYPLVQGKGYVAIRHFNCTNQFILGVDDIEICEGAPSNWVEVQGIDAQSYQLKDLVQDAYYSVQVSADGGTTWSNVCVFKTQMTTDLESLHPSAVNFQKVLRNGQIYILRGEKVYTLTGQKVK